MDPRFLKWMGETLSLYAANLEASKKIGSRGGIEESEWSKVGKYLPTIPPPLCSVDEMDECYREWLKDFRSHRDEPGERKVKKHEGM